MKIDPKNALKILNLNERYYKYEILPRIPSNQREGKNVEESYLRENFLPPKNHMSVKEVSSLLNLSANTIINNQSLRKVMIRHKYWIPNEDIDETLDRLNKRLK